MQCCGADRLVLTFATSDKTKQKQSQKKKKKRGLVYSQDQPVSSTYGPSQSEFLTADQ